MSYATRHVVDLVTATGGAATGYTPEVSGPVRLVKYIKDATTPFADGVDFTITSEQTGQNIWVDTNINASEAVSPRQATHGTDGAALLYAAGGVAVNSDIVVAQERIKIVIAAGGDAKLGQFVIVVG